MPSLIGHPVYPHRYSREGQPQERQPTDAARAPCSDRLGHDATCRVGSFHRSRSPVPRTGSALGGELGHALSKSFGRNRKQLGITDQRKTFHSFRPTLIDDLRDAGVQDSQIKCIAGPEDGAGMFSIYGRRSPLRAMPNALYKVTLYKEGSLR